MQRFQRVPGLEFVLVVLLGLTVFDIHPVVRFVTPSATQGTLCVADGGDGTDPNGDGGGGYTGG